MSRNFLWGSATAAYQCEGGWREGNKGLSNWDVFCHSEKNDVNPVTGDVDRMPTVFPLHGQGFFPQASEKGTGRE